MPTLVAERIRSSINTVDDDSLAGGMARAMLEYLAAAWDTYDDSVDSSTILSDTQQACKLALTMAKKAL